MKRHPLSGAHDRARALRLNMTDAEKRVWRMLRFRQIDGHRFRRQVPLGRYIVCHEARLIVEIDGGQHDPSATGEIERTRFLELEGDRVLRFWNNEVLTNLEGVYEVIAAALAKPSPSMGEGREGVSPTLAGCSTPAPTQGRGG